MFGRVREDDYFGPPLFDRSIEFVEQQIFFLRQHVLRSEKGFQFANESRVHEGPAAIWRGVPTIVIHAAGWQCRSPATRAVLV